MIYPPIPVVGSATSSQTIAVEYSVLFAVVLAGIRNTTPSVCPSPFDCPNANAQAPDPCAASAVASVCAAAPRTISYD